nr:PREDICTED: uncharacterized protein LOC109038936 [Bemisia tabaci]
MRSQTPADKDGNMKIEEEETWSSLVLFCFVRCLPRNFLERRNITKMKKVNFEDLIPKNSPGGLHAAKVATIQARLIKEHQIKKVTYATISSLLLNGKCEEEVIVAIREASFRIRTEEVPPPPPTATMHYPGPSQGWGMPGYMVPGVAPGHSAWPRLPVPNIPNIKAPDTVQNEDTIRDVVRAYLAEVRVLTA